MADIRAAQDRAWANKLAKGFNVTDVPTEFGLLVEEIGEAFSAWRKGSPGFGGELADVAVFLLSLAQMTGVDLEAEIAVKLAVNEARAYAALPNGTLVKAGTPSGGGGTCCTPGEPDERHALLQPGEGWRHSGCGGHVTWDTGGGYCASCHAEGLLPFPDWTGAAGEVPGRERLRARKALEGP